MTAVCAGDAISWLCGWASLWHPPQHVGRTGKSCKLRSFLKKAKKVVQIKQEAVYKINMFNESTLNSGFILANLNATT
jgi:hypothetical protein